MRMKIFFELRNRIDENDPLDGEIELRSRMEATEKMVQ